MWEDELYDPDYYDEGFFEKKVTSSKRSQRFKAEMKKQPTFFHQPINTYSKNILNAVTGYEYPYRIGSKDELRFYVVMENDPLSYKDARRLFFESPQQYENITGRTVSQESKKRFYENRLTFM